MTKAFRLLAICTIAAALAASSIAWAQTYTTVDYPGADDTSLNGGPNPQGAAVGSYDAPGIAHGGFVVRNGMFTPIDVPVAGPDAPPRFISLPRELFSATTTTRPTFNTGSFYRMANTQPLTSRVRLVPISTE